MNTFSLSNMICFFLLFLCEVYALHEPLPFYRCLASFSTYGMINVGHLFDQLRVEFGREMSSVIV